MWEVESPSIILLAIWGSLILRMKLLNGMYSNGK